MKPLDKLTDEERKALPLYDGLFKYFPNALCAVAMQSISGQEQHLDGGTLRWDRTKSADERGSLSRHLMDLALAELKGATLKTRIKIARCIAWRALALLEKLIEQQDEEVSAENKPEQTPPAPDPKNPPANLFVPDGGNISGCAGCWYYRGSCRKESLTNRPCGAPHDLMYGREVKESEDIEYVPQN